MKKIILLLYLLGVVSILSYGQKYKKPRVSYGYAKYIIRYDLAYQWDSTDTNWIRNEEMLLLVGDTTSRFSSNNYHRFDTIFSKHMTKAEVQSYLSGPKEFPGTAFSFFILKNSPRNRITTLEHNLDGSFMFEDPLDQFNWEILGDTKLYDSLLLQKAKCKYGGREWTAWFCPQIPINDGPYYFNGLPGLIYEIEDSRKHYVFRFKSIEIPSEAFLIDHPDKRRMKITKLQFFQMEDAFKADIISRVKDKGATNRTAQTAARNVQRQNNPIELKRK